MKAPADPGSQERQEGGPCKRNRPPILLRLPLARGAHEHPLRVRLLPVDFQARQLRRQRPMQVFPLPCESKEGRPHLSEPARRYYAG